MIRPNDQKTWDAVASDMNEGMQISGTKGWKCKITGQLDANDEFVWLELRKMDGEFATSASGIVLGYKLFAFSPTDYVQQFVFCDIVDNGKKRHLDIDELAAERAVVQFPVSDFLAVNLKQRGVNMTIDRTPDRALYADMNPVIDDAPWPMEIDTYEDGSNVVAFPGRH